MKVDFRLSNCFVKQKNNITNTSKVQVFHSDINKLNQGYFLSFTANPLKDMSQTASIAPEYQGILNSVYKLGGLGNVAGEASVAFSKEGKMDFRTFVPYYAPDNILGGIKVKTPLIQNGKPIEWEIPKYIGNKPLVKEGEIVNEKIPAYTFKSVPTDYILHDGEDFVIHEPVNEDMPWKTAYKILEDTGITGQVESISEDLEKIEKTPYKIFSIKGTGIGDMENPPVYIVHTPELARFPIAYKANKDLGKATFEDAKYGIFSRATIDAMPKFNNEKFGNFNPGNFWLHDRQTFPSIIEISEKSAKGNNYWTGIRAHASYHNPGRGYQGHFKNPIDFMKIVGSSEDLKQLQKNEEDYAFVKDIVKKIKKERITDDGKLSSANILTKEETARLNEIFKPLYGDFIDETGEYNLCKIPVAGIRKNPYNFSAGTVSKNYGKEMKNHNTLEIAPGLTKDFASVPTINIVNGSSANSMKLDMIGDFGKNNGFTEEIKQGFTPLTKDVISSSDMLFQAKQNNKKWFLNTVASAANKGQDALNSLFFSKDAINKGANVLGKLSEYKEGDVLFIGWGRPVSQKGFPTTLEGIIDYFKNENIPSSSKDNAKFLISAGPWAKESSDWRTIQKQMEEIKVLENGKYKNNVCYLNGFFTNRIVACADFSNITSRYEPCGITPLESYAGGTPVISINTGGSPDFILPYKQGKDVTGETGFLTKNAYFVNPEVIGAEKKLTGAALDEARRIALGKEISNCIEQAMDLFNKSPEEYKKMMTNAINSKIDWHENAAFNGGLSAIEQYKENVWAISKDNKVLAGEERNILPLSSLKGQIQKRPVKELLDNITEKTKGSISFKRNVKPCSSFLSLIKTHKVFTAFVVLAGVCTGIYINATKKRIAMLNKFIKNENENTMDSNTSTNNNINTVQKTSFSDFSNVLKSKT